jgi:tetratricopeptide (TPR) repeat protein
MSMSNESKVSTAFSEGLSNLLAELKLAIQWNRPSILLAIYKTESIRIKAEKALEQELNKISQTVKRVKIDHAQPDVTKIIFRTNDPEQVVFSITGIRNGGGDDGKDAYRAINVYREIFVEHRFRTIFWLTENESRNLPQFAPDFWAFRHRVIEFALDRLHKENALPSGVLLWSQQDLVGHPQRLKEDIQYFSQLLLDLPENSESVSTRVEILFSLAYFDWINDNLVDAKMKLSSGFDLANRLNIGHIKAEFLNAMAIISYELQNKEEALSQLEKAIENNPQDSILNINLGITYQALGQRRKAIVASKRATSLEPKNPRIWNALGHLFLAGGQIEAAQSSFERALSLDPQNLSYHLGLAICHSRAGDLDKMEQSLYLVNRISSPQSKYYQICEKGLRGNSGEAIQILKEALRNKELLAPVLCRDPILQYIFDTEIIRSLR